jgi:site-specific DNA-methyltransferase (adenine-specific)
VLIGSEPFSSALRMSNIKNYKYDWKWNKQRGSNFATVKIRPFNSCEDILVFYRKQCVYNSQKTKGKAYKRKQSKIGDFKSDMKAKTKNIETINHGFRYPLSILNYPMVGQTNKLHNTQKPLPLMEYLIKTYTNENETVLDFTMGSGTTMLACKNLNRNGIGIEMDANYYAVAVARVDS